MSSGRSLRCVGGAYMSLSQLRLEGERVGCYGPEQVILIGL